MAEFDTWVPYVRDNVSRPVMVVVLLAATVCGFVYAREQMLNAAFYLGIIVLGNAVLWKMEAWTSARDRSAREARVPTGGWGADPRFSLTRGWGLMDRLEDQKKVKQTEKQ